MYTRYYSNAVLDHIHRAKALDEWYNLSKGDSISLERALGCFDMFVLHDNLGDFCEVRMSSIIVTFTSLELIIRARYRIC